ncbi:hypothetical protein YC2023_079157 [Brassica napus]
MGSNLSAAASTNVRTLREHPPSSYSLKIHNFSQFEKSTTSSDHKYKSRIFSSGGYNWRLIIYPQGNGKDNGSGYISMYVEIESESLMVLTPPTEVFAEIRFFVYNKKENKYLTIQVNYWHNEKTLGGGWVQFLSLPELRKVYLDKEDALKVEIAFEAFVILSITTSITSQALPRNRNYLYTWLGSERIKPNKELELAKFVGKGDFISMLHKTRVVFSIVGVAEILGKTSLESQLGLTYFFLLRFKHVTWDRIFWL